MTVIAYRDGVMAADSCWSEAGDESSGLVINTHPKVIRLDSGALYGAAGATDDRELVRALNHIKDKSGIPTCKALHGILDGGLDALVALPDGTVWRVYTGDAGGAYQVTTPFTAVGVGAMLAAGAMAHGATAEEAVKIACEWNVYCRLPVTKLKLK